MELNFKAVNI